MSVAENLNKLLSFTMPDGSGGEIPIDMTQSDALQADPNFTFDQFKTIVTADGQEKTMLPSYYYDADGDIPDITTPVSGTLTATWSYKMPDGVTVKTLSGSDLSGKLNACNAPYTLTIKADNVNVKSLYGDPRTNSYTNKSQSYTVNVTDYKICYAKPNSIKKAPTKQWYGVNASGIKTTWNDTANTTAHPLNGGGYKDDFVPYAGFKATASTKFPTTGFNGAQFQLIMSNAQSDYTYSIPNNPGNGVSIDTSGNVTLNSKPTGAVTIRATPTVVGFSAIDYTFDPRTVWARFADNSSWPYVKGACGTLSNYFTRAELTNSPTNTAPIGSPNNLNSFYTRAIGEGLFSEWGFTDGRSTYPLSAITYAYYFTQDKYDNLGETMFAVLSGDGSIVYIGGLGLNAGVICRN